MVWGETDWRVIEWVLLDDVTAELTGGPVTLVVLDVGKLFAEGLGYEFVGGESFPVEGDGLVGGLRRFSRE